MTLRGGYAVDSYDFAPPPDPVLDEPRDTYLETYTFWGLAHLDPDSWRHYLPHLINYALKTGRMRKLRIKLEVDTNPPSGASY
jgi:hypothetical protein